jgi:methylated-DNA-protein-cysteine methyltransferase-like protein
MSLVIPPDQKKRYRIVCMEPSFSARVYDLALSIPPGRVTTYGILAKAAGGGTLAARSITNILSKAPNPSAIPYHRIVYAGGKVWWNADHEESRRALYEREGIEVDQKGRISNFEEVVYYFN